MMGPPTSAVNRSRRHRMTAPSWVRSRGRRKIRDPLFSRRFSLPCGALGDFLPSRLSETGGVEIPRRFEDPCESRILFFTAFLDCGRGPHSRFTGTSYARHGGAPLKPRRFSPAHITPRARLCAPTEHSKQYGPRAPRALPKPLPTPHPRLVPAPIAADGRCPWCCLLLRRTGSDGSASSAKVHRSRSRACPEDGSRTRAMGPVGRWPSCQTLTTRGTSSGCRRGSSRDRGSGSREAEGRAAWVVRGACVTSLVGRKSTSTFTPRRSTAGIEKVAPGIKFRIPELDPTASPAAPPSPPSSPRSRRRRRPSPAPLCATTSARTSNLFSAQPSTSAAARASPRARSRSRRWRAGARRWRRGPCPRRRCRP